MKSACCRQNCPSDAITFETYVSRELRMYCIQYTCALCGATYTETYQNGKLISVEYPK